MSRPFAEVIGDPIVQSKSPAIHNFWLGKLGIEADYRACHVRTDELADYLAQRRDDPDWRGCNVTMPHKQAVVPLLDRHELGAELVGAVNTIIRRRNGILIGSNTDGAGFAQPLPKVAGEVALVVGSGGAARAILMALSEAGIGPISLVNRNRARAARLLQEFELAGSSHTLDEDVPPAHLLVNASSLGMSGYPPFPEHLLGRIAEGGVVYDIVTSPVETALLQRARAAGFRTIDGLSMLIGQAAVAFEKFFGQAPPRERDGELRGLLTS